MTITVNDIYCLQRHLNTTLFLHEGIWKFAVGVPAKHYEKTLHYLSLATPIGVTLRVYILPWYKALFGGFHHISMKGCI